MHLVQKDLAEGESAARQQHKALSEAIVVLQQDSDRSSQQRTQVWPFHKSSKQAKTGREESLRAEKDP